MNDWLSELLDDLDLGLMQSFEANEDNEAGFDVRVSEVERGYQVSVCSEWRRSGDQEEAVWERVVELVEAKGLILVEEGRQGLHGHKEFVGQHAWTRWGTFARSQLDALARETRPEGEPVLSGKQTATGAEIKTFCVAWPPGRDWVLCDADTGWEADPVDWSSELRNDKVYRLAALGDTSWDGPGGPPNEPPHSGDLDVPLWVWFEHWRKEKS